MNDYTMEELIPVVTELSEKYTSKESSSISYEKAQQLMEAVIYCINELDMSDVAEREMQYLQQNRCDAKDAYRQGYQLVVKKVIKVKEKYEKMIEDFESYGNQCLSETVLKGIPGFLRYYDAKYAPQDHILTFDYPTLMDPLKQCGVDAVYTYVSYIDLEQQFLHAFSNDFVQSILENSHNDHDLLLINISSMVMRNIIGAMIAKKPISTAGFSALDYSKIEQWVIQNTDCLEESLTKLLGLIIQKGYQNRRDMFDYFRADMNDFSVELKNACRYHCLCNVIG